jgi:hypothetical protein
MKLVILFLVYSAFGFCRIWITKGGSSSFANKWTQC